MEFGWLSRTRGNRHTTQIFHFNGKTCDLSSELSTKPCNCKLLLVFSRFVLHRDLYHPSFSICRRLFRRTIPYSKFSYFRILCNAPPIVMGLSIMYISILNCPFSPYFSPKWLNFHIRFVMPNVSVTNRVFKDIYYLPFCRTRCRLG